MSFSQLARGVATWDGGLFKEKDAEKVIGLNLPLLVEEDVHRHGVTVSQRSKSAASCRSIPQSDKPDGELNLPKTYITRKGALMLFTASEDYHQLSEHDKLYLKQAQKLLKHRCKEYSNKLGSLSRLAQSVLTFGDEDYEKDEASLSDKDSKMYLKFPRGLDSQGVDLHTQPGGDLSFYLQELQSHASPGRTISRMLSAAKRSTPDISQSGSSGRESAGLLSADQTDRLVGQLSRPASRATTGRSSSRVARSALGTSRPRSSVKSAGTPSTHSAILETASPPYNMSRPPSPSTRPSTAPATRPGSSRYRSRPSSMSSLSKFGKPSSISSGSSIDSQNAPLPKAASDSSSASTVPQVTQAWGTSSTSSSDPSTTQADSVETQREHNASPQREQTIIIEDREGEEEEEEEDEEALRMAQHIGVYLGRHTPVKMDLAAGKSDSPSKEQMMEEDEANRQEPELSQDVDDLQEQMLREEDADKAEDEGDRDGVTEPLMPPYRLDGQCADQELLESRDEVVPDADAEGVDADVVREGQEPSERSRSSPEGLQRSTDGGEERGGNGGEGDFLGDDLNPKLITVEMKSRHSSVASSNFDPASVAQNELQPDSQESKEQGAVASEDDPVTGSVPDASDGYGDGLPGEGGATEVTESARSSPLPEQQVTEGDFVISDLDPRPIKVEPESGGSSDDLSHGNVLGARADTSPVDQGDIGGQGDSRSCPNLTPGLTSDDPATETLREGSEAKDTLGEDAMDRQMGEPKKNDKERENAAVSEQSALPHIRSEDTIPAQPVTTPPPSASTLQPPQAPAPEQLLASESSSKEAPVETKAKDAKLNKKSSASPPKKEYVKALNISSKQAPPAAPKDKQKTTVRAQSPAKSSAKPKPEKKLDLQAELAELMAASPGKPKEEPAKKPKVVLKPPSPPPVPKKSKEEVKLEKLEQEVTELFGQEDNGEDGASTGDAGLTAEEMEIEQQLLKEKVQAAENMLKEEEAAKKAKTKKKGGPTKHGKKVKKEKPEEKRDLAKEREALREARRLQQQRRIEEAKQLEQKIKEKEEEKSRQERDADIRKKEIEQELHAIRAEEEEAQNMEEEAREMMAVARRAAREEREAKRKAEQEKKKMEAQKKRDKEKQMIQAAREKEKAMLLQIASAEEKRKMMEEERSRREEEEALERERQEEEEARLKLMAEEEEERIREMERQAEEEAIARLVRDKEEAEARRRHLQEEAERIREEEERRRRALDLERERLEEERLQREEREAKRRAEEEQRKLEFLRQKEEAAEKMREEMAQRRELLLRRRDQNLERRSQLRSMKHGQGMTKPWVFTYYVNWPRETYERKIGGDDKKKRGFRPKPKPKPKSA